MLYAAASRAYNITLVAGLYHSPGRTSQATTHKESDQELSKMDQTTNITTTTGSGSNSLAQILSVLQRILSTTELDQDRRSLPILPQHPPPTLDDLQKGLARQETTSGQGSKSASASISDSNLPLDTLSRLATHLIHDILPYLNLGSLSPNYYGFVTGGATPAALLGDLVASVYDQNVQVHLPHETVATTLEVAALNKLVELFRLPEAEWAIGRPGSHGGGIFTTGATASNVLGLALGREYVLRRALERKERELPQDGTSHRFSCGDYGIAELMVQAGARKIQVLSTLSHSSMAKAASVVGIGRKNVVSILAATDSNNNNSNATDPLRIDLDRLETEARKTNDGVLSILTLSAGEVNTGRFATDSLDTMARVRSICDQYGVWIHVDGAFGLFARLFDQDDVEYRELTAGVQGLDLADSITADCHKLLNVPYDCGVFFTKHRDLSEAVFANGNAAYLTSAAGTDGDNIQSPLNIGIENSRRFRALPVYCTLAAYGREGYLDMLKRQVGLARRVTRWLLQDDRFDVLPGGAADDDILAKTFIVVLFRVRNEKKRVDFVKRVNATGRIYLSGTVWEDNPAARIAVSNWQVDVEKDAKIIEDVFDQVVDRGS